MEVNSTHTKQTLILSVFILASLVVSLQPLRAQTTTNDSSAIEVDSPGDVPARTAVKKVDRSLIFRDPVDIIQSMGTLGWIFLALFSTASVIALWFAIERLVVLRRGRVIPRPFVDRFLDHLEEGKLSRDEALQLCHENNSPVADVFAHGIRKWGKPSVEVEQAIIDGGERQVSLLRKHLRVLNGVATVTPLIGLLGTVCGMILAFDEIATKDKLGSDIGLALMTTAAGLSIAIPSLILYMYLAGRVDGLVMDMDQHAQEVVHLISAEGLSEKSIPAPRVRKPKHEKEAG